MRRVLAAVVAVALIGGAFVYRTRGDQGGDGTLRAQGPIHLVCTTELADVCNDLDANPVEISVRVEPAWMTVERLLDETAEVPDAWLAAGPWPVLVDEERKRRNLEPMFESRFNMTATPLVALVDRQKLAALPCASAPTWSCLAGAATASPVQLRLGMADPASEAEGTLVIAAAVGSAIGESEYASNDFEGLPAESLAVATTRSVNTAASAGGNSAEIFLGSSGTAFLDAWTGLEAELRPLLDQAARKQAVTLITPTPKAVVAAMLGQRGPNVPDAQVLLEALRRHGWTAAPPPATEDGLPSPGVLVALSEVIR